MRLIDVMLGRKYHLFRNDFTSHSLIVVFASKFSVYILDFENAVHGLISM